MTLFDYITIGIIALSILISLARGVIYETASILRWIMAGIIGKLFYQVVAEQFLQSVQPVQFARVLAFILLFVLTFIVVSMLRKILENIIRSIGLGSLNRIFGGVFGCIKGIIIVVIIVMLCQQTSLPKEVWWREAVTLPFFNQLVEIIVPYLPEPNWNKILHQDNITISPQININVPEKILPKDPKDQ